MDFRNWSIEEKVGQMLMFAFHGTEYNNQIASFIHEMKIGGIVYFARNITSISQTAELNRKIQEESETPLFIGLDQEGGSVLRIFDGITPLPGAMALSAGKPELAYEIAKAVGCDLRHLGFNMNFAPVGDVNNNPLNPVINSRSYSDDPYTVSRLAVSTAKGFQESKILSCIKHFPGHGNTSVDSHIGLPVVNSTKEEIFQTELVPFINAIRNHIDGIMVSHIVYGCLDPQYPSTLSEKVVNGLLKQELGYQGLVVTDSLTMGAVYSRYDLEDILYRAVSAGNDILVFCGKADLEEQREILEKFVWLVKAGKIPPGRIEESVAKILKLKEKYCTDDIDPKKIGKDSYPLARMIQDASVTKVFDHAGLLPVSNHKKVLVIFPEIKVVTLVDNEKPVYCTLGKYIGGREIIINQNLENLEEILNAQKEYDKIIMAVYNVKKDDWQQKVFDLLDKKKTIVVSMRSPYDILCLQDVQAYVCIYEATKESFASLARAVRGEIPFTGKLPIKL